MTKKDDERNDVVLTRGTKKLISEAIAKTGSLNSSVICNEICDSLCEKFMGESLDYQLNRMNITSTQAILNAIDIFIYQNVSKDGLQLKKVD